MLCDAARSLEVGPAWELHARIGPLIRAPRGDLDNALKTLEPGESWALRPEPAGDNPNLWTPGIKYGVQAGSYTHRTEFFGPVLGVMPFATLDEAIDIVNATGYGLTSGLHSLDEREQARWKDRVLAGNLYINRGTTGAIVLRQPFGGMGKSSVGPGIKPGGPNYLAQFLRFTEKPGESPASLLANEDFLALREGLETENGELFELPRLLRALASYEQSWENEFSREHDHFHLLGQDNIRRYLPFSEIRVRVDSRNAGFDIFARACAARITGARVLMSCAPGEPHPALKCLERVTEPWAGCIEFIEETDEELAGLVRATPPHPRERLRFSGPAHVPAEVRKAAAESAAYLADAPVLGHGRIELLWYLREQSISYDYHRYGNLGARAAEERTGATEVKQLTCITLMGTISNQAEGKMKFAEGKPLQYVPI
jgi:RHH-type proline utilization regulon transcriptional repressor/proline dehydrogenase/delta 1-pyrroline-5-carboxylate dehydrogenase